MLGINIFYRWKNDDAGWLSKSTLILWPSMQELVARLGSFFCGNMVKVHLHVFEAWALCAQLAWRVLITFALLSEFEVHFECVGMVVCNHWSSAKIKLILLLHWGEVVIEEELDTFWGRLVLLVSSGACQVCVRIIFLAVFILSHSLKMFWESTLSMYGFGISSHLTDHCLCCCV